MTLTKVTGYISIDDLHIYAFHGVGQQEAKVGAEFVVSVSLEYDIEKAAYSDSVDDTIDYGELTSIITDVMRTPRNLLETVAVEMQRRIMGRWPAVGSGILSITKLHPPIAAPTPRATITVKW